ncbi:MAG: leucine--tRNA ligase [Chitinophagales bacterium]|nr:leucine--tRNA ligase [Bacteroidota bacterium]MCB9043759.1 leucine--tRNA ligase [Chitinophagales bacterium]
MDYNFKEIEAKFLQRWENEKTYQVSNHSNKPKYYVLDMFPYPSGAGLHVGHPLGYIASDIYARFKRMSGFNVLHPMGFDAFGLPAEQYAIQTGQHPAITTAKNIATFKSQLRNIGFDYDWDREVNTSDPKYYHWTQWIFVQLFHHYYCNDSQQARPMQELVDVFEKEGNKRIHAATSQETVFSANEWKAMSPRQQADVLMNYRLAFRQESEVWWCEGLGTVLANDEVKDGFSERGGFPVLKRKLAQWFLRITAYSERLLSGLDKLEWSEALKEQQRHWIGKSKGATVFFPIENFSEKLEIFTTRPDTIFGATFMVLAPEHPWVNEICSPEQQNAVAAYVDYVNRRSERERQAEKKISGVFTGAYCIHPFTGKKLPIWLSEYVLAGYGTGAIMAVPADDERDLAFAEHFDLEIIDVVDKSKYPGASKQDKLGIMINSDFLNGMEVPEAIEKAIAVLEEKEIGWGKINYRQRDAGFSRQRYWGEPFPIIYNRQGIATTLPLNELPLTLPEVSSYLPSKDGRSPLANLNDWVRYDENHLRETDTMPGYAGSSWYFLRYMDAHNDQAFASKQALHYWKSVDLYLGGSEHAVGHLLYARFWHKFLFDLGYVPTEEPFQKLINQGMIQGRSNLVYRIKETNQFVSAGLKDQHDTIALHIPISFVDKNDVLDLDKLRNWHEDFREAEFLLENGKYVCGVEVEKMSKRMYNTVDPNEIVAEYGADTFRMFEMFLGPIEQHKPWDTKGIEGVAKFIRKFWRLFHNEQNAFELSAEVANENELKILHKTIKKVSEDIERFSFNTAVSSFMVCANELSSLQCNKRAVLEPLCLLIAPFAPFIAEELWALMGNTFSIHQADYPQAEEKYLIESTFEYPIMINGKLRHKITLDKSLPEAEVKNIVLAEERVQQWTNGNAPKRFIYVASKIINIVV